MKSFIHDGMIFYYSNSSMNPPFSRELKGGDFVGFYFDKNNVVQPVYRESLYGRHVYKHNKEDK